LVELVGGTAFLVAQNFYQKGKRDTFILRVLGVELGDHIRVGGEIDSRVHVLVSGVRIYGCETASRWYFSGMLIVPEPMRLSNFKEVVCRVAGCYTGFEVPAYKTVYVFIPFVRAP
jgi:hypothetical protein